jgi:hypothetical protein
LVGKPDQGASDVYQRFQSLSPAGLLIDDVEIGPDRIVSPPDTGPPLANAPIADGHPGGCTAVMSGACWTCPRTVARFSYGSRFADFAAAHPVVGDAFSQIGSTRPLPADPHGALSGSKRSSIISALPWAAALLRLWRGG